MMLNQQEFNKQLVDSQNNFMKSTSESLQSILVSLPTMMRQYEIEAQALNPAPLSTVAPQLMLTMANSAPTPLGVVPPLLHPQSQHQLRFRTTSHQHCRALTLEATLRLAMYRRQPKIQRAGKLHHLRQVDIV